MIASDPRLYENAPIHEILAALILGDFGGSDEALPCRYTTEENGLTLRRYWTDDCQSCAIKRATMSSPELRGGHQAAGIIGVLGVAAWSWPLVVRAQ